MERSNRHVRHWALDVGKYFGIDPVVVKTQWSVGDVVEAIRAIETYEALQEIAKRRAESEARQQKHANGGWMR